MIERDILAVLSTKGLYLKHSSRVLKRGSSVLSREVVQIIKDMREYFSTFDQQEINWAEFSQWFFQVKHKILKDEAATMYRMTFEAVSNHKPAALGDSILAALEEQAAAEEIAVIAGHVAEGNDRYALEDAMSIADQWKSGMTEEEEEGDDWDIESLLEESYGEGGYNWRMEELNISCGPLRDSNLVLFGARPNVGKTTILMSEVGHMATQIQEIAGDRCVLAIHNEEGPKYKLQLRWLQAVVGWTPKQINENKQGAMDEYTRLLGTKDRIVVRHMPGASVSEIEALLVEHNPAIIVVDQLRLCSGFGQSNTEVERLKDLYRWARIQASKYGPFLTVHQAGDAAEGKLYPSGNMLEGCKTEIQGALDLQIMIGAEINNGQLEPTARGMNIVKNKLPGSIDSDPSVRHKTWDIQIDPATARYIGSIK